VEAPLLEIAGGDFYVIVLAADVRRCRRELQRRRRAIAERQRRDTVEGLQFVMLRLRRVAAEAVLLDVLELQIGDQRRILG